LLAYHYTLLHQAERLGQKGQLPLNFPVAHIDACLVSDYVSNTESSSNTGIDLSSCI